MQQLRTWVCNFEFRKVFRHVDQDCQDFRATFRIVQSKQS